MSDTRAPRGRPKGSGIDDRQRLDAIARMIASNPQLKPTTAIRATGVSDPSVIRRLRDKFNVVRTELMQELQAAAAAPVRSTPDMAMKPAALPAVPAAAAGKAAARASDTPAARPVSRSRAIAAAKPAAKARVSAASAPVIAPARTATARDIAPARNPAHKSEEDNERAPGRLALPPAANQFLTAMFSVGFLATNTLMAAHTTMANEFIRSPYMSLALRQQLAFSEWAIGLVPTFPPPFKTAT